MASDPFADYYASKGNDATPQPKPNVADPFSEYYSQKQTPEKTSGVGTFFREGVMATPATIAGIGAGEMATAATAPFLGPAAPVAGLVAGGAVGFGVSYLGEKGMDELESMGPLAQKFMKTLGVDHATREAGRKEHEYAALAGQIASGGPFMSTAAKNIGQRAVGGTIQAGVGSGTRAVMGEEQDPVKSAMEFGAGFAAPGQLNKLGKKIPGVRPEAAPTPKPSDIPERPPADSSPEVLAEHAAKLDAIIAKRKEDKAAKAPLEQAAMINTETGELIKMGPKHDPVKKAELKNDPAWQEGFLDTNGAFHERVAAVDQAKRSGQIPEDHVLESPPGERGGLHTGDMRKAGVKEFDVTSDTPAGVSTSPSVRTTEPVTRKEHKTAIDDLQTKITELHKEATTAMAEQNDARVVEADKQIAELKAQQDKLKTDMPAVKFADMSAPTWKELHDHLWGANNMGEAFDRILAVKGLGSYAERLLIKGLNESEFVRSAGLSFTNKRIKYIDKHGVEKQDAVGLYTGGEQHHVEIGKDINLADFAHEGMHAGTQRLLIEEKSTAAIQMKALFDKYKASHGDASYGFNDVHEFVAEAFTNKEFQNLLKAIPVGQQPKNVANNAWGTFKEIVRLGLGIPEGARTALDEVMDKGVSMIKQSGGFTKRADRDSLMSPSVFKEGLSKEAPEVVEAIDKVDPRSMPDKEAMYEHAANIQEKFGKDQALKFVEDYNKSQAERSIPVPHNEQGLDDALHKVATFETKDRSELTTWYKKATESGVTKKQLEDWFLMRERGEELPPEAKALHEAGDKELAALVKKIKAMGGDIGDEFLTGQSRVRVFGGVTNNWREMLREFFANKTPMGEKMADQANSAMERSVFGLKTWTGDKDVKGAVLKDTNRVIELHKHPEDTLYSYQDEKGNWKKVQVKQGTSIWEWKDGKKTMIGHSKDLELKRGSSIELKVPDEKSTGLEFGAEKRVIKSQAVVADGKVPDIEKHAPYRYLKDSLASQAVALMGLRKMSRDLELMNNLTKSDLFKAVGHAPDAPLKDLPKGWKIPDNIDKIPQLRGWHFDPKTAAIIEDFAKVWDNTMWMKLSNQVVKNMMLNPIPHMFNEVMHLWNARGFTGWLPGTGGLSRLKETGRQAWRDVGDQTKFYRDLMREGGSLLGADPRNKLFDQIIMNEGKKYMEDPATKRSMGQLAKKLGTSVGDLYNGISSASQKAMWFTRDVMYVQYIREIMKLNPEMSMKDAIAKGEQHMPNYRMPSEVLGSRGLAKTLKNPNISMFSRYHYGMVKSLVNTVKDIDPRNLRTPEGRKHFREGVDSTLAIGVAMGVLYPLMDTMAEAMFGEGAEQRRAGPYHLLKAGIDVAEGKKDASALIWPVFTFNPALLSLGQLAFNKNIFTGKAIYHPQDPMGDIASDVGTYAAKQVPQVPGIMGAVQDEGGASNLLAKQLDIKAKTERQKAREKRAIEYGQRDAKNRAKQRAKGTYIP